MGRTSARTREAPLGGSGGVTTLVVRAFGCPVGGRDKSEGASILSEGWWVAGEAHRPRIGKGTLALLGGADPVEGVHFTADQCKILFALLLCFSWGELGAEVDRFLKEPVIFGPQLLAAPRSSCQRTDRSGQRLQAQFAKATWSRRSHSRPTPAMQNAETKTAWEQNGF
jgi:hypothetical protein